MDDEFFNTGLDLNGDGKNDLIEKAFETDDFEHTLDESDGFDNTSSTAKRKTNRGITCLILIIAFGVLLVLINKLPDIIIGAENRIAYTKAEKMITDGDYSNARDELQKILGEYKDSDGLNALCRAHEYESEGDCKMAYVCLYDVTFRYQNAEQMSKINIFKSRWNNAFTKRLTARPKKKEKPKKKAQRPKQRIEVRERAAIITIQANQIRTMIPTMLPTILTPTISTTTTMMTSGITKKQKNIMRSITDYGTRYFRRFI